MNINILIQKGAKILRNKFIKSAQLDSEILMAKVLERDRKYVILNSDKVVHQNHLSDFKKLIKERSNRKPIAQIIKKKFFWNSEFLINKYTLIPRPDTELIVESALKFSKNRNELNILDIGVGSGCILLSILKERKKFYGTGIDISRDCLNITKLNAINLNLSSRLRLYKSNVDKFNIGKYDLIVSNPPYIDKLNLRYLEKDVVGFEPRQALYGGLDGLSEIRKVIKKSSELIKKNGKLILEIGFDQKNRVIKILKKKGFYINSTQKDLAKNDRCIVCTKIT